MSSSAPWFKLNDWTVMAVTGPQALPFLQGQVTCDVRDLQDGKSRLGAHCTPKGRMQFSFRILALDEEHFLLRVPTSMVAAVKESLGKYILFSKAELTEEAGRYQLRGLYGDEARATLSEHLTEPPDTPGDWRATQDGSVILALGEQRYECWLSAEASPGLEQILGAPTTGDEFWRLLDIRAGIGEVLPQTREQFTPQALNFPLIGAVSFRKGCYTGQEIVARLHYKGKLKSHMRRLHASGSPPEQCQPGVPLHREDGKKAGELVTVASDEQGALECLAVLDDSALEQTLSIGETFSARVGTLPYTVE
ncbi:YgfZ/GcvT domain-containing protein [Marinimicrobium agarilyticum]|uniref:CAF17-like 4Fe-4S cluster assembly/insertion protein YgfZ n=1 Tax=Marinimicrobium agarilyticum TaxID=306546 RepID=UPI0003F90D3E|nr:folate-binding protein YgfZ [Marinimicrobium agarilyticum]